MSITEINISQIREMVQVALEYAAEREVEIDLADQAIRKTERD
jgi:hypothetical protein